MSNFPRWCLFFDFHTMPANPDVGKGFDIEAITDRFAEAGYRLQSAALLNMFPATAHFETIAVLAAC